MDCELLILPWAPGDQMYICVMLDVRSLSRSYEAQKNDLGPDTGIPCEAGSNHI